MPSGHDDSRWLLWHEPIAIEVGMVRRYLVVANRTLQGEELAAAVRDRMAAGPCEFWVLVPASPVRRPPSP